LCIIGVIVYLNKPYEDEKEYLKKNYSNISLKEDDFKGFEILDKDLKGKKIVLTGEEHYLDKGYTLQLKMLKYLQKEIGVNYFLKEIGYGDAHFINKYLESGDETILKDYFSLLIGLNYANEGYYNLYKNLYEFNQTLPKEQRIKVVGVDVNTLVTDAYILDILKNENLLTDELKQLLLELQDFNYHIPVRYKELINIVDNLIKDIEVNEKTYIEMFGEDAEGFKYAVKSLRKLCETFIVERKDKYNLRDFYIYENFKELDAKLENPTYFGQLGGAHIYQERVFSNIISEYIDYFGCWLNRDEKYKGKVLSLHYGYYSDKGNIHSSESFVEEDLFKDFLETESETIIFKLNSRKSPFKERAINPFTRFVFDYESNPTTNYYEYMILIKNSEYSKKLEN